MIEDICYKEDLKEERIIDQYLQRLKMGDDIENKMVMGYLKNENSI